MDKYKNFSIEDFLQDKFFNYWVKNPGTKNTIWERWLADHPEMLEVVQEAKNIICAFDYQDKQISEDFYKKLKKRIDFTVINEEPKPGIRKLMPVLLKIAAVFTGLVIAGGVLFYWLSDQRYMTFSSKYAETKKIILPDSSEVLLNANSFLKYSHSRNKKYREVWLNGEGFFKIKHIENSKKVPVKLIVHTSDVDIEVLGTEFNINSRDTDKTEVLLTRGKVRLSVIGGSNKPLNMNRDEFVSYNKRTKRLSVNKVSPDNYIAWTDHKYIFEKTSLEDLCKELQRYYGKTFTITDVKMRKQRLSGALELQNEDALVQTLSTLLGVSINKNGNEIIICST